MHQVISKILMIALCYTSVIVAKSLSQIEERAIGEYLYKAQGPQQLAFIEFENYFLYELNRICALSDVKLDYPLTLRIIDENEINAFATSGSFVFIYTGIMKQLPDVSELMGVLCHELTHTKEHHIRRRFEAISENNNQKMLLLAALPMVIFFPGIGELFYGMAIDQSFIQQQHFSQQMEYEADAGAIELMRHAGFDTTKLVTAFESIGRYEDHEMLPNHFSYYSSHPLTTDRISRIKQALKAHPHYILAVDRSQLDYTLLLSRFYQPYEKMALTDLSYLPLIQAYREALLKNDIDSLLKTYPHSVMLRLDKLQELLNKEQWQAALAFHHQQEEDVYWKTLPIVESALAIIDSHQLTQKEFIRKYQSSLLKSHVCYEVLKHLALCFKEQGIVSLYYTAQAKYYLESGDYEEALDQLKHHSVDKGSIYAQKIQAEAELMINVNRRLR